MRKRHLIAALSLLLIGVAAGVAMLVASADLLEAFEQGGKWGFKNRLTGMVVVEPKYDNCYEFSEGLAAVAIGEKWGFIDEKGTYIVGLSFEEADAHHEGLARVKTDGKYGFVNLKGEIVIEPTYAAAGWFSSGLAPVQEGEKWGYIGKDGAFVLKPQYETAISFVRGLAVFGRNGRRGVIDPKGNIVVQPIYEKVSIGPDHIRVYLDGKIAKLDRQGKQISDWEFQRK